MTKLELTDMVTTELTANPILEEVSPGDGPDEHSSPSDDIAAIDATTADYTAPPESTLTDKVAAEAALQAEPPVASLARCADGGKRNRRERAL